MYVSVYWRHLAPTTRTNKELGFEVGMSLLLDLLPWSSQACRNVEPALVCAFCKYELRWAWVLHFVYMLEPFHLLFNKDNSDSLSAEIFHRCCYWRGNLLFLQTNLLHFFGVWFFFLFCFGLSLGRFGLSLGLWCPTSSPQGTTHKQSSKLLSAWTRRFIWRLRPPIINGPAMLKLQNCLTKMNNAQNLQNIQTSV